MKMFKDEPWFASATRALELEGQARTQKDLEGALHAELPLYFAEWTRRQHEFNRVEETFHVSYDAYKRRADEHYDVRGDLENLKMPVVIISGERDFLFGGQVATWLDAIPGSKRIPIPKAGHMSHIEQPEEFRLAVEALAHALR
jgi:pimeloyl-ACP methyl ester carboxylesterase